MTLDPERDRPQRLAEYAQTLGLPPNWILATGAHDDLEELRYALGVYDPDPVVDRDRTQHAGLLVYGDPKLDRWSAISSLAPPQTIADAVLRLIAP